MRRGFSLLEVLVAMAILAVSLMAIFSLNSGAVANHAYTKKLTVATLLARGKMIDLEQELYDKGFSNDDDEESGDFSDEGWPSFKWRAKIIAPKTNGLDPQKLIGALFNLPLGGEGDESGLGGLAALFGGGGNTKNPGAIDPLAALGPAAALAQGQFTQMIDQITKAVREVHLTVSWKEGKLVESIDLVTHVVSLGPGSDRNGLSGTGATSAPGTPNWVRQDNGAPVANPVPGPGGTMVDPTDNMPVIPLAQWMAQQSARNIPGAINPRLPIGGAAGGLLPGGLGTPRPIKVRPQ
ncbi:MAG: type IV pilus modification PilV family protein [Myxococcota bacterium]